MKDPETQRINREIADMISSKFKLLHDETEDDTGKIKTPTEVSI